jgi:peptide/nickel transport system permease protein
LTVLAVAAVGAPWLPLTDPDAQNLANRLAPPQWGAHPLGTDGLGRDILSRVAHGARTSLTLAGTAVLLGAVTGGVLGLLAGFFRGPIDSVVLWLSNVVLAFPGLILLLFVVALHGHEMTPLILAIAALAAPGFARLARAHTLALAQREHILAAHVLGAGRLRILRTEVLPDVARTLAAFALVATAVLLVLESSLAFLGLSVDGPTWGETIAQGRQHMSTARHPVVAPSAVLFLTVLAMNFVGDVLRSRFDVKESRL